MLVSGVCKVIQLYIYTYACYFSDSFLLKSLLMREKEESEKADIKLNIHVWQKPLQYCKVISLQLIKINGKNKQTIALPIKKNSIFRKTKIMTSGLITSWQINGEIVETVTDFLFFGSKITVDVDCSHEIERHLLFGKKAMTNLDSMLKIRDITFPTKIRLVKAMVFPVAMYRYKSWTINKAECQRIDAFELWCWRRLLRVPWTSRKLNHSILKEIHPEYSLEGLMLKLKL